LGDLGPTRRSYKTKLTVQLAHAGGGPVGQW
jgi:hypothetical protein